MGVISELIAEAVHYRGGKLPPISWNILAHDLPQIRYTLEQMEGRKEDRVREFDRLMEYLISEKAIEQGLKEFFAGYFMSLVADGQMKYVNLASSVRNAFPLAPVWFGFLGALASDSDVLTAGACLGRRLLRHLTLSRDPMESNERDIALEELELGQPENWIQRIRTEHLGQISIELFPGIVGQFKTARGSNERSLPQSGRHEVDRAKLRELKNALGLVDKVITELIDDPQGDLLRGNRGNRPSKYK